MDLNVLRSTTKMNFDHNWTWKGNVTVSRFPWILLAENFQCSALNIDLTLRWNGDGNVRDIYTLEPRFNWSTLKIVLKTDLILKWIWNEIVFSLINLPGILKRNGNDSDGVFSFSNHLDPNFPWFMLEMNFENLPYFEDKNKREDL